LTQRIAGDKTPQLVSDVVQRAKLPVLVRTEANETSPGMLLDCIDAGVLGILNKPASTDQTAQAIPSLIWSLKAAAGASVANLATLRSNVWPPATEVETASILAIGAGMGGALALGNIIAQLPA